MKLVLASNNQNKLKELDALLSAFNLELIPQGALNIPEADEPFQTFVENALQKARHAARESGLPAIADDSGICVQTLGGLPGVHSARYAQQHDPQRYPVKSDEVNNQILVEVLKATQQRDARFLCVLVAVRHADDPEPLIAIGRWNGEVLDTPRGTGGFGYDPLMYIPALQKTVAELSASEKNQYSHRAQAMQKMKVLMQENWSDLLSC